MWVGAVFCWIALFGASYATTVNQLVGLQGVLYGVGGGICYVETFYADNNIADLSAFNFTSYALRSCPRLSSRMVRQTTWTRLRRYSRGNQFLRSLLPPHTPQSVL